MSKSFTVTYEISPRFSSWQDPTTTTETCVSRNGYPIAKMTECAMHGDAEMLAAGPDMLRALEEVEEYIAENCGCEMDGERAVVCDLHSVGGPAEAVRFAIAKAKGEL